MQDLDSRSQKSSQDQEKEDLRSQEDQNALPPEIPNQSEYKVDQQILQVSQTEQMLTQKVYKQLQLIYIAKYSPEYRQLLEQIAHTYGCNLSFGKNSYLVSCKEKSNLQRWTICKEAINEQFNKIIYTKIEQKQKRCKLYNSPQVNRFANQKGIYFCQFNHQILIHTNRYSHEELKQKRIQICKYCNIYTVCFSKKKTLDIIDMEIAKFYRTVLEEYYFERFNKNNLVVQINKMNRSFYILGKPGTSAKTMMEAKATIKGLIQGCTVIAFKNNILDQKGQLKLPQYVKKISKFPITYGKLSQNVMCLISKDNIIKQLLKKTDKILQKVGITQDTSIGLYMPFCWSREQKNQQIHKICKQLGFDYWSTWGIKYFRPMIASEDDIKNPTQILELIIRIIGGFVEVKDKYQVIKQTNQVQDKIDAKKKKQLQQQDKYAYILKNSPKDSIQYTKAIRRDVMEDQVLMKKRYNVIYNLLEGKEIGPYFIDQLQYDKGIDKGNIKLIELNKLKKGLYFEVFLKISDSIEQEKQIEELQKLLLQEMKKLKKAAKQDKQEGKSLDTNRKIAHMIKKQITVF